ncbi:hypothetical protein LTS18_006119, partial [Coniosporium uncinatum]
MPRPGITAAEHPSNIEWQALGPAVAFCSLTLIAVAARWYTRTVIVRAVGWDDFLITVSMVMSIGYVIIVGQ